MTGPMIEWATIRRLFGEVVDLAPATRLLVLNRTAPPGSVVRREVDALLAAHESRCGLLDAAWSVRPTPILQEVVLVRAASDGAWKMQGCAPTWETPDANVCVMYVVWSVE